MCGNFQQLALAADFLYCTVYIHQSFSLFIFIFIFIGKMKQHNFAVAFAKIKSAKNVKNPGNTVRFILTLDCLFRAVLHILYCTIQEEIKKTTFLNEVNKSCMQTQDGFNWKIIKSDNF